MNYKLSGFSDEIAENVTKQFEVLSRLGIGYFEPRGIDGKNISELTAEETRSLKKEMDKYGICASSVGSPIGKINLKDDFGAHFEKYKRIVETAGIIGTRNIRIFSFYHDGGEWTAAEHDEVFLRLEKMIDYAKNENVMLLHENEKDIYGDTAARCADLMKNLSCENFCAVFDPANYVQCGEDTQAAYETMKNYIEYMHIKDACKSDGRVVPAGMGDGKIKEILKQLFADGYCGFLSLEPHLGNFAGLNGLENGDIMKNLPQGGEGTFTAAHIALMKILKDIEKEG